MNKYLKYIKIKGILKSRGEYITDSAEYRPYDAVTILDSDGEEIHFHSLIMLKRMDDAIDYSKEITFYILRARRKDKMAGVLYAVDTGTKKIYYPDLALEALKSFALGTSLRIQNFGCLFPIAMLFLVVIGLTLHIWLDFDGTLSALIGGITGFIFMLYPMFTKGQRAGISEMQSILMKDGFDVGATVNSKY